MAPTGVEGEPVLVPDKSVDKAWGSAGRSESCSAQPRSPGAGKRDGTLTASFELQTSSLWSDRSQRLLFRVQASSPERLPVITRDFRVNEFLVADL